MLLNYVGNVGSAGNTGRLKRLQLQDYLQGVTQKVTPKATHDTTGLVQVTTSLMRVSTNAVQVTAKANMGHH